MSDASRGQRDHTPEVALPEKRVTANQIVGYNLAWFRKAAGLTQGELGAGLGGWSAASVSAAERSWDGKRGRKFDADELVRMAATLGIPVIAFFLPPPDDGTQAQYVLDDPNLPEALTAMRGLFGLVMPVYDEASPAMVAFRRRLASLAGPHMDLRGEVTEQLTEDARATAKNITSDARVRAESLERDARERHRQAMGSLVQQREELESRVDDLRAFERDYRARLLAYLEGQIRDLKAGGVGEAAP